MLKAKTAIVLNTVGIFGGAERRFTGLFRYLYDKYPDKIFYIVSYDLYNRIKLMFYDFPFENVFCVGPGNILPLKNIIQVKINEDCNKRKNLSFFKKVHKFKKNYLHQRRIFREIRNIQLSYKITILLGVASAIIPLYFYFDKKNRPSIIYSNMDSWFSDIVPDDDLWYRKYSSYNFAHTQSDIVDFLSPFILEGIKERGINIPESRISITPCSFSDYSKCSIGDKKTFSVVFTGRLEERKNPFLFLDAVEILLNKYPDIIFHIMGEGRLSEAVYNRCQRLNSKNVIFHGFHKNPPEILSESSAFISIQETNNYPSQSILEAMACGNAVIASDVGDTRMFINENNGILISLDKNELVDAIEKLYLNREMCRGMGSFAYKYVRENHTIEKCADYYVKLFNMKPSV